MPRPSSRSVSGGCSPNKNKNEKEMKKMHYETPVVLDLSAGARSTSGQSPLSCIAGDTPGGGTTVGLAQLAIPIPLAVVFRGRHQQISARQEYLLTSYVVLAVLRLLLTPARWAHRPRTDQNDCGSGSTPSACTSEPSTGSNGCRSQQEGWHILDRSLRKLIAVTTTTAS